MSVLFRDTVVGKMFRDIVVVGRLGMMFRGIVVGGRLCVMAWFGVWEDRLALRDIVGMNFG